MTTRRQLLAMLGGGAALVGGAALGIAALPHPAAGAAPAIRYGQESCAYCGMSISDPRFAGAWRAVSEQHFDDIGCLVNALRRDHPAQPLLFVHDFTTSEWLDATLAYYLLASEVRTPMAYHVAAFRHREAAERAAALQMGAATDWAAALSRIERKD